MDYEKKYKEAIERAKKVLLDCTQEEQNVVEYIYPELAESEDEKTRKFLINFIKLNNELNLSQDDTDKLLAWIEKQGEQKPADTDFSDLRTWKYIVDAVWTEKEGIGQYLDSPFTEEIAKKLQKRFGNIEQKPEWSEEDEELMEWSINNLTELKDRFGEKYGNVEKCIDWLKSLRPQNRWNPTKRQLLELTCAISECPFDKPVLIELEGDLKKLMEE